MRAAAGLVYFHHKGVFDPTEETAPDRVSTERLVEGDLPMLSQVRWLRVVIAAFLIEVGLIVTTLPFILIIREALVLAR